MDRSDPRAERGQICAPVTFNLALRVKDTAGWWEPRGYFRRSWRIFGTTRNANTGQDATPVTREAPVTGRHHVVDRVRATAVSKENIRCRSFDVPTIPLGRIPRR